MSESVKVERTSVRLYEIVALVKYAVVVAATSKDEALKHIETWEKCWPTSSDFIGVSDVELMDVRKLTDAEDEAHEVTESARAAIAKAEGEG